MLTLNNQAYHVHSKVILTLQPLHRQEYQHFFLGLLHKEHQIGAHLSNQYPLAASQALSPEDHHHSKLNQHDTGCSSLDTLLILAQVDHNPRVHILAPNIEKVTDRLL